MIKQKAIKGLTHTSDIRVEFLSSVTGNIKQQIIINQCTGSRPSFRVKGLICTCNSLDIKTVIQMVASRCLQVTHHCSVVGRLILWLKNIWWQRNNAKILTGMLPSIELRCKPQEYSLSYLLLVLLLILVSENMSIFHCPILQCWLHSCI